MTNNEFHVRFGIHNAHLVIISNNSQAKVEILFQDPDAAKNQELFDRLFIHKDEIEKRLDSQLVWDRGVPQKRCKIDKILDGIDMKNEEDWEVVATFHAEWTRKFYDEIITPYLKND